MFGQGALQIDKTRGRQKFPNDSNSKYYMYVAHPIISVLSK